MSFARPATTPAQVQRTYLILLLFSTLSSSLIWGINTLFLLDAGLSNTEAFAANAFFTAGQVLFEVPTGVVADSWGRRASYILGTVTLSLSTVLYWLMWSMAAPFWAWAAVSVLLGLGFTFFSGATEAWLVDALNATKFKGTLESVFARGQIISGGAMLVGAVGGGLIAQATNLGLPYLLRGGLLAVTFVLAWLMMRDLGFKPERTASPLADMRRLFRVSLKHGLGNPPVRWVMLSSTFTMGVSFYAFYAMQPYLLELYGDPNAYGVAGLAAAVVAGSQMVGGFTVPWIRKAFRRRTSLMITSTALGGVLLMLMGLVTSFYLATVLFLVMWALLFAVSMPVRQAYLNGLIPSQQRATVLSFDSLMGSSGGVVTQPLLGRAADLWGYAPSYVAGGIIQILALPCLALARRARPSSDKIEG